MKTPGDVLVASKTVFELDARAEMEVGRYFLLKPLSMPDLPVFT